jgi:hypothetical protein
MVLRQKKDNTNYEMTKRLDHTKYEILHLFFFCVSNIWGGIS